eukprot:ctg_750.g200
MADGRTDGRDDCLWSARPSVRWAERVKCRPCDRFGFSLSVIPCPISLRDPGAAPSARRAARSHTSALSVPRSATRSLSRHGDQNTNLQLLRLQSVPRSRLYVCAGRRQDVRLCQLQVQVVVPHAPQAGQPQLDLPVPPAEQERPTGGGEEAGEAAIGEDGAEAGGGRVDRGAAGEAADAAAGGAHCGPIGGAEGDQGAPTTGPREREEYMRRVEEALFIAAPEALVGGWAAVSVRRHISLCGAFTSQNRVAAVLVAPPHTLALRLARRSGAPACPAAGTAR